tara:strand:+ start:63 stop:389 length:327 start_codon:yes stop_codon:yes gene_type:complete
MNEKDKHTSGPWGICAKSPWDEADLDAGIIYSESNCKRVAVGIKSGDGVNAPSAAETKANAALIAAAPCLLAALELIVPDMQHYVSTHGSGPDKRLDVAYAAIERARQ